VVTRLEFEAGACQAAVDQARPSLDLVQLALDDADQAVQVDGAEVTMARLSGDQMPSAAKSASSGVSWMSRLSQHHTSGAVSCRWVAMIRSR
jgi:hypothetical protein